jgi:transcriptional regulator with XRE-family HTH domain
LKGTQAVGMLDKEINKKIGRRLRQFREAAGLNREDLANTLKVSQATVANMERGIVSPKTGYLYLLYIKFGLNINWLLTGNGPMNTKITGILEKYPELVRLMQVPQVETFIRSALDDVKKKLGK